MYALPRCALFRLRTASLSVSFRLGVRCPARCLFGLLLRPHHQRDERRQRERDKAKLNDPERTGSAAEGKASQDEGPRALLACLRR